MIKNYIHLIRNKIPKHYNLLLIFLILLFLFRPYEQPLYYLGIWKLVLTASFLYAVIHISPHRNVKITAIILSIPSVLFSWLNILHPESYLFILNALFTIVFMILSTCTIIFDVVVRARVTMETLIGVICAYFMLAFAFGYIFYLLEFLHPGSFNFALHPKSFFYTYYLSELFYFSFVTLLTIGYGDITATHAASQTAAVVEGIIGQFYVAILVARVVTVYSKVSDKNLLKAIEKDVKELKSKD